MERESFEDASVAAVLNKSFVSIKVDREERPDIDNIYMSVCQAFTGGGGWPTSIFMTWEQKPFFAGTYFPKTQFMRLLAAVEERWSSDMPELLRSGEAIVAELNRKRSGERPADGPPVEAAVRAFRREFDPEYGGFGNAPKFPAPHNLMFLLRTAPDMAEKTLLQMFRGGIFDHIGYGFSRYSTDRFWLAPHFEKMLYDNALLVMAYLRAFELTGKALYADVAKRTLIYIRRELESPEGGFYSAQDADSEGVEGKYYLFTPAELTALLGETDGRRFCAYYGITEKGNFEGRSIPNLIGSDEPDWAMDKLLPKVYDYRKARTALRLDDKILTAWNALTIAALADAGRILGKKTYITAAERSAAFAQRELTDGNAVFSGTAGGRRGGSGFLDDYAFFAFAQLALYQATLDEKYLKRAAVLTDRIAADFWDDESGGFFFSGRENEKLIARPKVTYDGAIPSGNSVMAYNLSRLAALTGSEGYYALSARQNAFMNAEAASYPSGYGFYLYAALPTADIVCVPAGDDPERIKIRSDWTFRVTGDPAYPPVNGQTTYYVCADGACRPPSNTLTL